MNKPPTAAATQARHAAPLPAAVDVVDLTGQSEEAHGNPSSAVKARPADCRQNTSSSSLKRKSDHLYDEGASEGAKARSAIEPRWRPTRAWYPGSTATAEAGQRLKAFRAQVASIDYDDLVTIRDPNREDLVRRLFERLGKPWDAKISGHALYNTVHGLIFDGVLKATTKDVSLTADGIVAFLKELPAPERSHLQSQMDVALAIAKAGRTSSFTSISRGLIQLTPMQTWPIYRPGQPYNSATLAAIRATPGSNIEPPGTQAR